MIKKLMAILILYCASYLPAFAEHKCVTTCDQVDWSQHPPICKAQHIDCEDVDVPPSPPPSSDDQ